MNTLQSQPFSDVLSRLAAAADASEVALRQRFERATPAERADFFRRAKEDYAHFYGQLTRDLFLAVSPNTRLLLTMLARASGARQVVEFGTSFGVSTLHLAAAVRDNGGGTILTTELEPTKASRARATFAEAGVADLIDLREGDALQSLARGLPEQVDFVLLDGAKPLYARILALLQPRLKPGALIVADNADQSPDYLALVREPSRGYLSLPFSDEVELSQWVGAAT